MRKVLALAGLLVLLLLAGCQEQGAIAPTATVIQATSTVAFPVMPSSSPTQPPAYPGPLATGTEAPAAPEPTQPPPSGYPPPEETPIFGGGPPDNTDTPAPYPGPQVTGTPARTSEPTRSLPGETPRATPLPAAGSGTPAATPTEYVSRPIGSPPPANSTVSIWLSWSGSERQAFETVIQSFQDLYPDIYFDILYLPENDLRSRYEAASYYGGGPDLLLGSSEWGPALYEGGLVADLTPYTSQAFLGTFVQPGLEAMRYQGALTGLPYALRGVVMYRNISLIPAAPQTWEALVSAAQAASRGGNLGAYLERGAAYSVSHLQGLGGTLMDAGGNPAFNDAYGLAWLDLMVAFRQPGIAPSMNSNQDVQLFMDGRIGIIVEGTGYRQTLAEAIGEENLAIDPWPTYGDGHLAGFVQADSLYLNTNVSGEEQYAALLFMGYLLDGQVQTLMAEVGHIPSVTTAQPRNAQTQQAVTALASGVPYPAVTDYNFFNAYLNALEDAARGVTERGEDPAAALQAAYDRVVQRLAELRSGAP